MVSNDSNTKTAIGGFTVVAFTIALIGYTAFYNPAAAQYGARDGGDASANTIGRSKTNTASDVHLQDSAQTAIAANAPGDAIKGKAIFVANCGSCHKPDGTGIIGLAPNLRNRDFLTVATDDFLRNTIAKGRPGTAMIPRPDLKSEQVNDVIAFLRDGWKPNPKIEMHPDYRATGDATAGAETYARNCAACHGPKGEGYMAASIGPGIGLAGFLATASDDFIFETIKYGRTGTPMRGFLGAAGLANLTEQDIANVIVFLRNPQDANTPVAAAPEPPAQLDNTALIAKGKTLFGANCAACHMPDGTGKAGLAPGLRNRDFLAVASDKFIRQTITKGRPGTAMIARPDLSEQAVSAIIAYLRDHPVANPVVVSIDENRHRVGDAAAGADKYARYCASCHGPKGEGYMVGGVGPGIGLKGFLDVASDDFIYETVKNGRIGTPMMGFVGAAGLANMTENDVADVITYLRSINK